MALRHGSRNRGAEKAVSVRLQEALCRWIDLVTDGATDFIGSATS
jgi:hypothetical protein